MFIYIIILCALVAITYLVQFQAYSKYCDNVFSNYLFDNSLIPKEKVFEYELTEEEQLAVS